MPAPHADRRELGEHRPVAARHGEERRHHRVVAVLAGHGDGTEQPGDHHGVGGERHQRLLVLGGGDECLAAVHVGPEDDGGGVDGAEHHGDGQERPRHLRGGELAELAAYES
jgi:hypothetical protein